MTPSAINKLIAEAIGWKNVHFYDGDNAGPGFWSGIPAISEEAAFKMPERRLRELREYGDKLPDFCNDLNACFQMEKSLTFGEREVYQTELWGTTDGQPEDGWRLIHSTAAQRAEAFLRTKQLWKE